jgi:hypothetical protein
MDPIRQTELTRSLDLLLNAALAGAVPIHIAFSGTPPNADEWAISLRSPPQAHIHGLGTAGSSWANSGLKEALSIQKRNSLIFSGFWLESEVTFLALPALATGFEVFVLMDVAPANADASARPATDRLLQAGAIPITTRQLVPEWIEGSPDAGQRSALSSLVPAD